MKKLLLISFAAALLVAALMSPFASSSPDGLERVAEDKGFLHKQQGQELIKSPIPDYMFPGLKNQAVATSAAGVAGTALTFGLFIMIGKLITKKSSRD